MTPDEWDALSDQVDALALERGATPAELAEWKEGEAESARQFMAQLDRVADAVARFPNCEPLARLAIRDAVSGRVIGTSWTTDELGAAFLDGAPAELVAEAADLRAVLDAAGPAGSPRWFRLALRLRHRIAELNRRLRHYTRARRTLSTAHHAGHLDATARRDARNAAKASRAAVAVDPGRSAAGSTAGTGPPGSTSLLILEPSTVAPLLRTGPPAALRRGHDRLTCGRAPLVAYGGDGRAA